MKGDFRRITIHNGLSTTTLALYSITGEGISQDLFGKRIIILEKCMRLQGVALAVLCMCSVWGQGLAGIPEGGLLRFPLAGANCFKLWMVIRGNTSVPFWYIQQGECGFASPCFFLSLLWQICSMLALWTFAKDLAHNVFMPPGFQKGGTAMAFLGLFWQEGVVRNRESWKTDPVFKASKGIHRLRWFPFG